MERACADATSVVELCRSVQAAIAPVVPADRWCGFAVDPATLFATNGYHEEGVDMALLPRLLELEYGTVDVAHVPALARTSAGVVTLSDATGGDLASSARWRDVLEPSGVAHELRAVFRDARHVWGALVLMRGSDVRDFTAADVDLVRRIAPTVATGFRRMLVRQHLDYGDDAREAGIVVLAGEPPGVRTATPAGRTWLEHLDDGATGDHLPTPVLSAARAAQAGGGPAAVRARTRSGRWVTITAERTEGAPGGEIGVVVQPSRPAEIARIVGAAHGLTGRETDVVLLVASGHTNAEIARALGMSRYTVADHLKSVFAKLEVVTRGELTSKLFHDHYLRRGGEDSVGIDSWFLPA